MKRAAFVAAGAALASLPRVAAAEPVPVRLLGFFSGGTLPYWAAESQGLFARQNIAIALTATPGSIYQFQHLSAGDFDVATTALDNIIAYDEGQGEAQLPNPADFVAFLGGDSGFLQLWVRPEIASYADLKGKLLAVDALTTGYAFVLRRMLEKKGIGAADYALTGVGNTAARFARMQQGTDCVGALLSPPVDVAARAAGFRMLDVATDVIGAYQAAVLVARRTWLDANGDVAVRLVRGVQAGVKWLYDPANAAAATALLAEKTKIPAAAAGALLGAILNPKQGLDPRGEIHEDGVRTVLELRSTYAVPKKSLTDARKYYDPSFFRRAAG